MAHHPEYDHDKRSSKRILTPLLASAGLAAALVAFVTVHTNPEVQSELNVVTDTVSRKTTTSSVSPHVVFFLVDDMGSNDVGYQSTDLTKSTPFMDELAADGIKLTNYYTEYDCTPSRAALMTGRLPISIGMQHECITPTAEWGLRKSETTMADVFKNEGYKTHIIGKWDLGHYAKILWPTERGFDSFFGLTCYGYTDYSTHSNKGFWDLQDWSNEKGQYNPDKGHYGVYSTHLFGDRAVSIVQNHPKDSSLFLYVPWNAVHNDLSVPTDWQDNSAEYTKVTVGVTDATRKVFSGALYLMDQEMKKVVGEMKTSKLYENSIIIMASDNGGSPIDGGNCWPMRGAKKTMFEGGQHVPAFIHSTLFAKELRGTSHSGLFHVTDWLPTLMAATDITTDSDISDKFDGYNMWDSLMSSSTDETAVRDEVLLNIDYIDQDSDTVVETIEQVWMGLLLTIDSVKYKLLINQIDYTYYLPISNNPYGDNALAKKSNYLFDITNDAKETTNLLEHTEDHMVKDGYDIIHIMNEMTERLCHLYNHKMTSVRYTNDDTDSSSNAKEIIQDMHNNWITFWAQYNDDVDMSFDVSKAPKCSSKELTELILQGSQTALEDDFQDVSAETVQKSTHGVDIDPNTGKPYFAPEAAPAPAPKAPTPKTESDSDSESTTTNTLLRNKVF